MLPEETSHPLVDARRALRRELRAKRRAIPPAVRAAAAERVALLAGRHFPLHPGQRIGLYSPLRDELDIEPLARLITRHGGRIYVPRLTDRRRFRMRFLEAIGPMRPNHLGILEPAGDRWVSARSLDLVFVPLVGFDASGMRLGMGAGYYDRAFAYLRLSRQWRRPKLIGVAFALQRVPSLTRAAHDVALDAVITEEGVITCRTGC
jgi:5-formyltetrahydrofolate cyclo-ligase